MKFKFVQIVAAALVIAGCAKEQALTEEVLSGSASENTAAVSETQTSLEPVTIWENGSLVAFRPDIEGMGTKLTVGADGTVSFTGGEAVLVTVSDTQGTASSPVKYAYDSSDQVFKVAEGFTPIRVLDGYTANIYYPYDCFSIVSGTAKYTMPSYNGTITNLGEKNPMAAKAQLGNATITMLNLASLIRIDLLGNENDINSGVKLSTLALSTSSAALKNGSEWSVDWTGTRPVFEANAGDETSRTVTCTFDGGVTLDADEATSFYFIAPYSDGASLENLTVTATNSDGNTYSRTRTSALSLSSSTIVHMGFRAGLFRAGDGQAEETAYEIATADDFRQMAKRINAESTNGEGSYHHACYKQVEDIDFREGYSETKADLSAYMIGVANNDERFTGTYDGGNKTLSYFSLSNTDSNTGLWSASLNATFKNIKVDNASISGAGYVGTIVANMYGPESYMSDCTVTNTTVTATAENAGGVIGRAYGTVNVCRFGDANSSVSGAKSVGGVIGNSYATEISNCSNAASVSGTDVYVGGVIGVVTDVAATVTLCSNTGNVKAQSGTNYKNYAAGIIGAYNMSASTFTDLTLTINDATNSGKVEGNSGVGGITGGTSNTTAAASHRIKITGTTVNSGAVTGKNMNVGGIVGYPTKTILTIEGSCRNEVAVSGVKQTGGIVGILTLSGSVVTGAVNSGNVTISSTDGGGIVGQVNAEGCSVTSCTNSGKIVSNCSGNTYLGGVVGRINNKDGCYVRSCTNNGELSSNSGVFLGGIVGYAQLGTIDKCLNTAKVSSGNSNSGGIVGGANGAVVKRCYNSKSAIVQGTNRVGGIVGVIETAPSKIVNCANYGLILGTANAAYCAGGILGMVHNSTGGGTFVANCLVRDRDQMIISTHKDAAEKYLLGGIVGEVAAASTFQSIFVPLLAVGIQNYKRHAGNNTKNTVKLYSGQNGVGLAASNNKSMSVTTGKTLGTTAVFKDCYVRGSATYGICWYPYGDAMTRTYVQYFSANASTDWAINNYVAYNVKVSDGNTFNSGTKYAYEILSHAAGLISSSDYTKATDEDMSWSDVSIGTKIHYAIPKALMDAFPDIVNEE